ncbi:RagB/SusD family nutrient uptake outer membrane protein [Alistipes sp. OttesenSCG-928-B03]|nr:RagB/SusD family nutrient uptake outer membrane protein [Alistipes sp. OttesenSCG-928-B03]
MKSNIITKISLLGALAITLTATGCQKWLEVDPIDKNLETTVYYNEKQIQAAHNGLYLGLAHENMYGADLTWSTVELLAQQYAWPKEASTEAGVEKYSIQKYDYSDKLVKDRMENIWSNMYASILSINKFINSVSASDVIGEEKKNMLLGEAYAMRAFLHFDILRLFGPVYSKNPDALSIPYYTATRIAKKEPLPASAVISKVFADLETALSMLENDPVRQNGPQASEEREVYAGDISYYYTDYRNYRFNYYAVCMLKARVLHYVGDDYRTAEYVRSILTEIDETFAWAKATDVTNDKTPDRVFYPEVLFGIHSEKMYEYWKDHFSTDVTNLFEIYLIPVNRLSYLYGGQDPEMLSELRVKNWVTYTNNAYRCNIKFRRTPSDSHRLYFQPLMRKTELYYILAECTGDTDYLTTVKEHRDNYIPISSIDDELTREYSLEMLGEGQLFYFYKRRNEGRIRDGSSNSTTASYVYMDTDKYMPPIPDKELNY